MKVTMEQLRLNFAFFKPRVQLGGSAVMQHCFGGKDFMFESVADARFRINAVIRECVRLNCDDDWNPIDHPSRGFGENRRCHMYLAELANILCPSNKQPKSLLAAVLPHYGTAEFGQAVKQIGSTKPSRIALIAAVYRSSVRVVMGQMLRQLDAIEIVEPPRVEGLIGTIDTDYCYLDKPSAQPAYTTMALDPTDPTLDSALDSTAMPLDSALDSTAMTLDTAIEPTETHDTAIEPTETHDTAIEPTETHDTAIEPTETLDTAIEPTETHDTATYAAALTLISLSESSAPRTELGTHLYCSNDKSKPDSNDRTNVATFTENRAPINDTARNPALISGLMRHITALSPLDKLALIAAGVDRSEKYLAKRPREDSDDDGPVKKRFVSDKTLSTLLDRVHTNQDPNAHTNLCNVFAVATLIACRQA